MTDPLLLDAPLTVPLATEGRVVLRRVRPGDKARLRKGLEHLSPQSTYQRFFTPNVQLSDQALRYLTEVDGVDHAAIAALEPDREGQPGVGVARYIRLEDEAHTAEAAVAVVDAYQGRGIGSLLLVALGLIAAENGIDTFQAFITEGNRAFARHLEGLGAEARRSAPGLSELRFPSYTDPSALPDTPAGRKHRVAYEALFAAAGA
jgi:GNAT superfamily N-acetyltransferase